MVALRIAVAGVLGLAVGSFLNVVIYRVPRARSVVAPSSSCPSCGTQLRPYDNIPLVSYLFLKGRCRSCGAAISVRYPIVEALNAGLWMFTAMRFRDLEVAAFVAVASSVLLALTVIDLEFRRLPNVIVLPSAVVAAVWVIAAFLARNAADRLWVPFASAAAAFTLLFTIAVVSRGMGFGDVKLAGYIGLVAGRFGGEIALVAVMSAFLIGGVSSVVLVASGRRGRKDAIPFGPSLAMGCLVALFAGDPIASLWLGVG